MFKQTFIMTDSVPISLSSSTSSVDLILSGRKVIRRVTGDLNEILSRVLMKVDNETVNFRWFFCHRGTHGHIILSEVTYLQAKELAVMESIYDPVDMKEILAFLSL